MLIQSDKNPIGAIFPSMLTEAQFQALNGTDWVLADGRSVAGTQYATITGSSTLPDLRGMVLRGKNNGRSDGNQDPAGERAVGAFQTHATAKNGLTASSVDSGHTHPINIYGNVASTTGNVAGSSAGFSQTTGPTVSAAANITTTISAGDAETRMRNVAVNHFIRIN